MLDVLNLTLYVLQPVCKCFSCNKLANKKVLISIIFNFNFCRITIGQDLVVSTTSSPDKTTRRQHGSSAVKNRSDSIKGSGRKALSFRSVQRQHSLVIKRDPMEDLALVNESIARLVEQVTDVATKRW